MTSSKPKHACQLGSQGWSRALPAELRAMIWHFTLPTYQTHLLQDSWSRFSPERQILEIHIPVPVAFQVCRESRQIAAQHLTAIPRTDDPADTRRVYCNLATDSLFLDMSFNVATPTLIQTELPAAWKLFKQIHLPPLKGFRGSPELQTEAILKRDLEKLLLMFPNTARLVPTRIVDPLGRVLMMAPGFLSFTFRDRHLLRMAWVGETAERPFPEHVVYTKNDERYLSMKDEHDLWAAQLAKLPEGNHFPHVRSAVAKIQCQHQPTADDPHCRSEGIVFTCNDERFHDNHILVE